jgi:WhiB family redox-sensing transcriptional regulator
MADTTGFRRIVTGDRGWMVQAACNGYPVDLFFPEPGSRMDVVRARAVCATCPVRNACLQYARAHRIRHGVWGGVALESERRYGRRAHDGDGERHAD